MPKWSLKRWSSNSGLERRRSSSPGGGQALHALEPDQRSDLRGHQRHQPADGRQPIFGCPMADFWADPFAGRADPARRDGRRHPILEIPRTAHAADETGMPLGDAQGEPVKLTTKLERPRLFAAVVFNADQADGLPPAPPLRALGIRTPGAGTSLKARRSPPSNAGGGK